MGCYISSLKCLGASSKIEQEEQHGIYRRLAGMLSSRNGFLAIDDQCFHSLVTKSKVPCGPTGLHEPLTR